MWTAYEPSLSLPALRDLTDDCLVALAAAGRSTLAAAAPGPERRRVRGA